MPALMCLSTVDLLMPAAAAAVARLYTAGCSLLLRGLQRGCTLMVKRSFARLWFVRQRNAGNHDCGVPSARHDGFERGCCGFCAVARRCKCGCGR